MARDIVRAVLNAHRLGAWKKCWWFPGGVLEGPNRWLQSAGGLESRKSAGLLEGVKS
jgi:hypothetical protein